MLCSNQLTASFAFSWVDQISDKIKFLEFLPFSAILSRHFEPLRVKHHGLVTFPSSNVRIILVWSVSVQLVSKTVLKSEVEENKV